MMEILIPTEYEELLDSWWREAAVYGGRFSLKSHTVARILLIRARQKKTRVACFREMQNSIADSSHQLLSDLIDKYKLTDFRVTDKSIINTQNGSDFLFKGLHRNEQSVKSTEGIDIAWVEEAQTITEKSLEILTPTVRKEGSQLIYTYNRLEEEDPIHKRLVIEGRPKTLVINTNYHVALKYNIMPDVIRDEMEDDKAKRPDLYKHKWLGAPMEMMESRIYKGWAMIDVIPHEARLVRRALDFGYTNDPSAMVDIYEYNGGYIFDEILYKKGQSNKNLADFILLQEEETLVIGDSAEPKSIDEIKSYGVQIMGAKKEKEKTGSKRAYNTWSLEKVGEQKISVTRRSTNIWKEYKDYLYLVDKDGKILNIPDPKSVDHIMDAIKYGMISIIGNPGPVENEDEDNIVEAELAMLENR